MALDASDTLATALAIGFAARVLGPLMPWRGRMEEQKTNFDRYLERKLRDPDFRARFEAAGQAWDIALQLAALLSELRAADNLLAEDWKAGDGLTIFLRSVHPPAATPGFQAPIAGRRGARLHDGKLPAGAVMGRRAPPRRPPISQKTYTIRGGPSPFKRHKRHKRHGGSGDESPDYEREASEQAQDFDQDLRQQDLEDQHHRVDAGVGDGRQVGAGLGAGGVQGRRVGHAPGE